MVDPDGEHLRLLRNILAQSIAEEERLYHCCVDQREACDRWRRRAELALRKGHQDMARQALERAAHRDLLAEARCAEFEVQRRYVNQLTRRLRQAERQSPPRRVGVSKPSVERAILALDYDPIADRLAKLEREDRLDSQLADLKSRLAKKDAS